MEHEYDKARNARDFLELVRRDPTVPLIQRMRAAQIVLEIYGPDDPWPPRIACHYVIPEQVVLQ